MKFDYVRNNIARFGFIKVITKYIKFEILLIIIVMRSMSWLKYSLILINCDVNGTLLTSRKTPLIIGV